MRINEIFYSIQGEGRNLGKPSVFIRLSGCNLKCSWCDTKYHIENEDMSIAEVVSEIRSFKCKNIIFTGGEPMLQMNDIVLVIEELNRLTDQDSSNFPFGHHSYELETNGVIGLTGSGYGEFWNQVNISPKLKNSGNSSSASEISLDYQIFSDFKFVVGGEDDMDEVYRFIKKYDIKNGRVWLMPEGSTTKEQMEKMGSVMEIASKNQFNFSPRVQVLAFDTKRKV